MSQKLIHLHQNVLAIRTQVKTLHEQQTSHAENKTETNLDLGIQLCGTASTSSIKIQEHL
jgi:hypothetical protein